MKRILALVMLVSAVWVHTAIAQLGQRDGPYRLRVSGTLLPRDTPAREDIVTVEVIVRGEPWLLRVGARSRI